MIFVSVESNYIRLFILFFVSFSRSARYQEWNDMNLRWNTSDYGGVKDLRM